MAHIQLNRTDASDNDFQQLVEMLDADLKIRDGEDNIFYSQFNKITNIRHAIVAYQDEIPVGCGAFKEYSEDSVEIKRMFVRPEYRGKGIANFILNELEKWAGELNYKYSILETGMKQPEALRLYERCGYKRIPNFGPYENVENSVCMKKPIPTGMNNMNDAGLIRGEIADYRYEGGILYSYSKSTKRTVESIRNNVALVKKITGNKKVPILIYLEDSPVPDKATRKFSTEQLPEIYTAMAMISKPGLAQLIMKILFRFNPPPIPMKSFSNPEKAREWLGHYI